MSKRIGRRTEDATPRKSSSYPGPFATEVAGRVKWPLGDLFGLDQYGVNLAELPPGVKSSQRHWHSAEDEFIYVLEGTPTLVTDAGEELLQPGDCAGFKAGVANGHCLVNRTAATVRYLEVGSRRVEADAIDYPDIDMKIAPAADGKRRYLHKDGTPY